MEFLEEIDRFIDGVLLEPDRSQKAESLLNQPHLLLEIELIS